MPGRWGSLKSGRHLATLAASLLCAAASGCGDGEPEQASERVSLRTGANPFDARHPMWAPQPKRARPYQPVLSKSGEKLYVTLQGQEDEPDSRVAVVDTVHGKLLRHVSVGASPTGMALHPAGRFLVVTNRFSNFASVIDTERDAVVSEIKVPFYSVDIVFTPDGTRAYLTNHWKDSVLRWDLAVGSGFRVVSDNYSHVELDQPMGIAVGDNPRDLSVTPDGKQVFVGAMTGMSLSVIDTQTDIETRRVALGSPPGDVVATDHYVFVTHTGTGTHHPPDEGFDTDGDGKPGDGTANVMFQDLQNEIAVFDRSGDRLHNYTSDSIAFRDYRDVDPDEPDRGALLPAPDTWPASRAAFLPSKDTWLVACALPEQMSLRGQQLFVVCSGSNEVQHFGVQPNGQLSTEQQAGGLFTTGMQPQGITVDAERKLAYVAERLGEYVTVLDLEKGPGAEHRILVGDVSGGEFPATDAEIGEAINFVSAGLSIDGDLTCVHCHREGGNMAKPVAMPLQADPVYGVRMQMAYRGAFDTRPWFFESAMDENNFFPVINEFARKENFCCEQLDPLIWSKYPSLNQCAADASLSGCDHVLHCSDNPPPECANRRYGSKHLTRNAHFSAAMQALVGRDQSFGDGLFDEYLDVDGNTVREGVRLDFTGATRAVGLFLMQRPRLLPNPNAWLALPSQRAGARLFESTATGCATCHPLPTTTISTGDPAALPIRFPALITPRRNPITGADADLVNPRFEGTFPDTEQDARGLHVGVPQLRGIWDRAARFYHDGRARSLLEALATPGHPALTPDQVGYNETNGMPDTHGATSHLSAEQLEDLAKFLESL